MRRRFILGSIAVWMALFSTSAQGAWSLEQCIAHAIEHNLVIKQQEDILKQNEIELSSEKWSRLPNLNGDVGHSFSFGRSLQVDNTYASSNTDHTNFSLTSEVPLFTGMKIPNSIALAKLNLKAATEDLNKAKNDISIQVASAYLQVLYTAELAKVAKEQVALSRDLFGQKEAFYHLGKESESGLYEARARVDEDELSQVQAENNYQLALLDLSQLLELPTPEGFSIVHPCEGFSVLHLLNGSPDAVYNDAVLVRPEIQAAHYRLDGAANSIRIAQSAWYPQISFSALISTNYYRTSGLVTENFGNQLEQNLGQRLSFNVSVPVFNRFSTRNRVRSARIQQNTLQLKLEDAKKGLYKEIQQAYYSAIAAESKYRSSASAAESSESSFKLMGQKYETGISNSTEYNEARTRWLKSLSNQIQAKYELLFRVKILDFYKGIPLKIE
ncbi:MAG: TolC family protein [Phocaeicola sp.]